MYGAARGITSAVNATTDLARGTLTVQRMTGMDTKTSSEWVSVLKERGVTAQQFSRSMVTMSKNVEKARQGTLQQNTQLGQLNKQFDLIQAKGGKKAPAALAQLSKQMQHVRDQGAKARQTMQMLGVPMEDIQKGRTQDILLHVADAFQKIKNPVERAALGQKLFGRATTAMMPVLIHGRAYLQKMLDQQAKYGNVLSNTKDAQTYIAQQREMKEQWNGLKVTLGTALLPAITSLFKMILQITNVIQPLLRQGWFVKSMIAALVIVFTALKVAFFVAKIQALELNTTILASPWFWVIAAIVALVVAVVILYKKWSWFHNAVDSLGQALKQFGVIAWKALQGVWNWVKVNWPLLVGMLFGPIGIAAALIITHFKQVKTAVVGVFRAIIGAARAALNFLIRGWNRLHFHIPGFKVFGHKFGGLDVGVPTIPQLAAGGTAVAGGSVLVGEQGPELVTLPPGAVVQPLPFGGQLNAAAAFGTANITVPVMLDRKVIAQAVARYTGDKMARR